MLYPILPRIYRRSGSLLSARFCNTACSGSPDKDNSVRVRFAPSPTGISDISHRRLVLLKPNNAFLRIFTSRRTSDGVAELSLRAGEQRHIHRANRRHRPHPPRPRLDRDDLPRPGMGWDLSRRESIPRRRIRPVHSERATAIVPLRSEEIARKRNRVLLLLH